MGQDGSGRRRVDVPQLLRLLIRAHGGEARVWSVVRVPAPAVEAARQLPRELLTLKRDRARVTNRIKALLALQGVVVPVDRDLVARLGLLRQWDGSPLPRELQARLEREWAKVELLTTQIRALEAAQRQALRTGTDPAARQVRQLIHLCGLGPTGAWLQVQEFFSWRQFHNRREVAALAGLVPAPYDSGATHREQGITKTGNRYMRTLAIELAWGWLRYQPASALSQWYERRFGQGSSRQRRIGIVALARRLLIALWEYLETGAVPEGAALKA